jgi:hypothetical protein
MKTNPILEEIRQTKDDLAREAGYDTHAFFRELRRWSHEHPHEGPVLRGAEELRRFAAVEEERRRSLMEAAALHDKAQEEKR